ncbi:MAG: GNAT family N-acetyltransferase [Gemmatimonadaceae bacterium]
MTLHDDVPRVLRTPAERAAATEENLLALFRAMAVLPGYDRLARPGVMAHYAPFSNAMFQGAWSPTLAGHDTDAVLDEVGAWFADHQSATHFWWFNDNMQPADFGERLERRGYALNFEGDPAMVGDLAAMPDPVVPPGHTVELATSATDLAAWRDVFAAAYELPASLGQAWIDAAAAVANMGTPWQLYLARGHGEPLGTSLLYCGGGVAGLFAVGTVPAARGRGIGAALTLAPMRDARARGYHHGVLFASPLGQPVYERLGFTDTGRRIRRYLYVKR